MFLYRQYNDNFLSFTADEAMPVELTKPVKWTRIPFSPDRRPNNDRTSDEYKAWRGVHPMLSWRPNFVQPWSYFEGHYNRKLKMVQLRGQVKHAFLSLLSHSPFGAYVGAVHERRVHDTREYCIAYLRLNKTKSPVVHPDTPKNVVDKWLQSYNSPFAYTHQIGEGWRHIGWAVLGATAPSYNDAWLEVQRHRYRISNKSLSEIIAAQKAEEDIK